MIKSHQQSPPPHSDPHPGTPGTVLALSAQALTLLFSFQIPGMTLSAPLIPLHSSQTVCLFGSTFPFWLDMLPLLFILAGGGNSAPGSVLLLQFPGRATWEGRWVRGGTQAERHACRPPGGAAAANTTVTNLKNGENDRALFHRDLEEANHFFHLGTQYVWEENKKTSFKAIVIYLFIF